MTYVVEVRRTAGAYKTVAACYNLKTARQIFEETKKNNGFGEGRPEVLKMSPKQQRLDPFVKAWAKVGGDHDNTIVRIREI